MLFLRGLTPRGSLECNPVGSLAKAGQHVGDGDRVHTRLGSAENLGKLSTVPNVLEPQLEQVWGEPQARAPGTGQ